MTPDRVAKIERRSIHELFEIGIILKGLNALLEFGLGVVFLFVNVSAVIQTLVQTELVEDPNDFLANQLQLLANNISPGAQLYSALYLISHGIIKGVLVFGLLRGYLWAYPASLAVLALFVLYQLIQIIAAHSVPLVALTLFDLAVMWLIWKEYQYVRAGREECMKKGEDYIGLTVSFLCNDGEGNVLLSKRGEKARDEHGRWDCGGGGVELGDTAEETVRKEIREEYCTDAQRIEFLGYRDVFRQQNGKRTHWLSLDFLVLVDKEKAGNCEPHKLDEVRWFPFDALPEPMHSQWPKFLEQYRERLHL